uniref:Peptidase A2 domain-containing protein n=1 Tax=Phytophthora ramorum TaxID=164328 RepID=H3H287_PHYRM
MEKVYDWDLSSWKDAMDRLAVLVGTVEIPSQSPLKGSPASARPSPPDFLPADNSDSSVESPKRMQMPPDQPPWSTVMHTTTSPAQIVAAATPGKTAGSMTTTTPQADVDVTMESVSSHGSTRLREARRDRDEDPDDLFDLDNGAPRNAAAISSATAGAASGEMTRVRLSAFSELKEFHGRDASEEKARAWLNRVKSASRRDGMAGDEVCALFGDLMSGPARQWYLQLSRNFKKSWTDLTEQFRIQYCGKGVSMASRYYHAAKRPDETPLEYLYRLNVTGMRAKIHYDDGSPEEKREHVELFINTLDTQEQELASRLTLMEIPDVETLEKKLRARQRGLARQKKTLFGSIHAIQAAADEYDSGRDAQDSDDQTYDQDRDVEERARLFMTGHTSSEERTPRVSSIRRSGDYERQTSWDVIDLHPGERRGYWKYYAPDKWYRQAKIYGKLNNRRATLLLDTGAEVSIIDTTFAREVGCRIDTGVTQNCVGIRDETYYTVGRTRIKVTLAGNLVYFLNLWVGGLVGQDAILGMNSWCLPESVSILRTVRHAYPTRSHDVLLRPDKNTPKLWVTRGDLWVTSVIKGKIGRRTHLRITNITDKAVTIDSFVTLAWWMADDALPWEFDFVQVDSRRYKEWQNLAYGATCDADDPWPDVGCDGPDGPLVEHPTYETPKGILRREDGPPPRPTRGQNQPPRVMMTSTTPRPGEDPAQPREPELRTTTVGTPGEERLSDDPEVPPGMVGELDHTNQMAEDKTDDVEVEDAVIFHEGSELFAEELQAEMAVLPEVSLTEEVKIEDLKVGRPTGVTPEIAAREEERLRRIIWKRRKWLIGKGNALPPTAIGVVCDIDVGDAKPVAQRVRKLPPKFKEPVSALLKGLLNAKMVQPSKSPRASPIVVIVKKNGVDIRLCIDYRLVNGLTQLMIYPMPLINDLLEDLDKYLWYCSLDMASGFWVIPMTDRARLISAFVTPFGLFEWTRMPFGLCNAPQIYQRLIDNALYSFWNVAPGHEAQDVFAEGIPAAQAPHPCWVDVHTLTIS